MPTFPTFFCLEWKNGAVCGTRLELVIKPPEHRLDIVLVSLLVALDNFHTLYWCFICDFEQVYVYRYVLVSGFVLDQDLIKVVI